MKLFSLKVILGLLAIGAVLFGFRQMALATPSSKITICHATSSTSNPYVMNQPNASGDVSGHDSHNGGVYFAGMSSWGDIIPPFDYQTTGIIGTHLACTGGGYTLVGNICKKNNKPDQQPVTINDFGTITAHYSGKNWDEEGQAVWNNSCNIPALDCDKDYDNDPNDADDQSCMTTPTPTLTPTPTQEVLDCDGDYDNDPTCLTTPTPTQTPILDCDGDTDGSNPNGDDACAVTPTVTPTATPSAVPTVTPTDTPTPTPTATQSSNNGGGDNGSSTPNSGSSNSNSNSPTQAVLSASTMAGTGTFENTLMTLLMIAGTITLGAGIKSYAKEKSN